MNYLLSLVTFLPLVGAIIILLIPEERKTVIRWTALVVSSIAFVLSLIILSRFDATDPGLQIEVSVPWVSIGGWLVSYHLGVDGISILLLLLTTFLCPIAILSTWDSIQDRVRDFMSLFLLLQTGMTGVFLAQDLVLFFIFWEFTLVPMYFLIGIWGSAGRRYASFKFFLYTMTGSVFLLLGIVWLGARYGSFSLPELTARGGLSYIEQFWLFIAFAVAFAVKTPLWPLHSWLPDAHVEAPTAGSVILAGVMLKMGTYGLVRFNLTLFPQATLRIAPWMAGLAIVGILYGAAVSYMQKDMKKLVAFSSVSHMGFVVLGMFALNQAGIQGSILQMVNHGLSTGALFLLVGMIYERRHTRDMDQMGGIWRVMPLYGAVTLYVVFSSIGLPALNGFVGEFTILLGTFTSGTLGPWFAGVATLGVVLAAVYLLHMYEKVFLGPVRLLENQRLKDLNFREIISFAPILVLILWIGLYPKPFFDLMSPAVGKVVAALQTSALALH
ncbi:MAG TPA: NADH-quinone oxidoreductase subunit M [Anaerolineaceae bacterium]|nr:NADH-quinone oxidoreductase subunit M [Anaerolineaceae bacterium]